MLKIQAHITVPHCALFQTFWGVNLRTQETPSELMDFE